MLNRKWKLLEQQLCAVAVKFRLKVHVVWVALPPIHHIGMPLAEFLQHSVAHKRGHHTAVVQVVKPRWKFFCVQGGYVLKQNLPSTKGGSILFPGQAILLYGRMFNFRWVLPFFKASFFCFHLFWCILTMNLLKLCLFEVEINFLHVFMWGNTLRWGHYQNQASTWLPPCAGPPSGNALIFRHYPTLLGSLLTFSVSCPQSQDIGLGSISLLSLWCCFKMSLLPWPCEPSRSCYGPIFSQLNHPLYREPVIMVERFCAYDSDWAGLLVIHSWFWK